MYIKSSQVEKIGEKNYLRIFLEKEYPYKVSFNGNEINMLDLVFEEPTSSDISELKRLSISLEKLYTYTEVVKPMQIMSYINEDRIKELRNYRNEEPQEEEPENKKELTPEEKIDSTEEFVSSILFRAQDFENNETNYFLELDKFFVFLDKKCNREHGDGLPLKTSLSILDVYNAQSLFIKEHLVIKYISFFFAHFPSRSLHINMAL